MEPITELKNEHRGVETMLGIIQKADIKGKIFKEAPDAVE